MANPVPVTLVSDGIFPDDDSMSPAPIPLKLVGSLPISIPQNNREVIQVHVSFDGIRSQAFFWGDFYVTVRKDEAGYSLWLRKARWMMGDEAPTVVRTTYFEPELGSNPLVGTPVISEREFDLAADTPDNSYGFRMSPDGTRTTSFEVRSEEYIIQGWIIANSDLSSFVFWSDFIVGGYSNPLDIE